MESLLWAEVEAAVGGVAWGAIAYSSLLSAVLGWVFVRLLPDKDKIIKDLTASKDSLHKDLMAAKDAELRETRADYRASLKEILAVCEKGHGEVLGAIEKGHGEAAGQRAETHTLVRQFRHEWATVAQRQANRRAREDLARKRAGGGADQGKAV